MDYYYNQSFWGMHALWWVWWIVIWFTLFALWQPVPRSRWRNMQATPHDMLQRRLANGDITPEDYEKRKALLDRDVAPINRDVITGKRSWKLGAR